MAQLLSAIPFTTGRYRDVRINHCDLSGKWMVNVLKQFSFAGSLYTIYARILLKALVAMNLKRSIYENIVNF